MKNKYISIGKILNFHGVNGEAKVGYSKKQSDFIAKLKSAFILKNNEYIEFKIKSIKFTTKVAIVKFDEFNSIDDVLQYKGENIYAKEEALKETLKPDEFLTKDLIGMDVFAENEKIGVITGISNNGATDLLCIKTKGEKISLVPFVKALVPTIDLNEKKVIINNIEGLF